MTFLGLKMIIFGHFSRFLASFKISFSSLQHLIYNPQHGSNGSKADPIRITRVGLSQILTPQIRKVTLICIFNEFYFISKLIRQHSVVNKERIFNSCRVNSCLQLGRKSISQMELVQRKGIILTDKKSQYFYLDNKLPNSNV